MELVYEKVADYHVALRASDPPVVTSRGKSKCAGTIDPQLAQALLDNGYRVGRGADSCPRKVFARH